MCAKRVRHKLQKLMKSSSLDYQNSYLRRRSTKYLIDVNLNENITLGQLHLMLFSVC